MGKTIGHCLASAAVSLAFASNGFAETQVWSENPVSGEWSASALNWDGGVGWTAGNAALFGESSIKSLQANGQQTFTGATFSSGGYRVSGSGSLVTPLHSKKATPENVGSGTGELVLVAESGANAVLDVPVTNAAGSSCYVRGDGDLTLARDSYLYLVRRKGSGTFSVSNCTLVTAKFFREASDDDPRIHFDGATLRPGNENQIIGMEGHVFARATVGRGGLAFGTSPHYTVTTERLSQSLSPAPELAADETDGGLALDAPYTLLIDATNTTLRGGLDIRAGRVRLASAGGIGSGPVTVDGDFEAAGSMTLTNTFLFGTGSVGVTGGVDRLDIDSIGFTSANSAKIVRLSASSGSGTVRVASGSAPTAVGAFALSGGVTLLADGDTITPAENAASEFVSGTGTLRIGNGGARFDTAGRDVTVSVSTVFDAAYVRTNVSHVVQDLANGSFESGSTGWTFLTGTGKSGANTVAANGSAFAKSGNMQYDTTNGTHFAVIRSGTGSAIQQAFTVPEDGAWAVSFEHAYRPGITGGENLEYAVYLDYGTAAQRTLRDFAADGRMHGFENLTLDPVSLTAGESHTLTIMAGEPQDALYNYDCVLVDAVRLVKTITTRTDVPVGTLTKTGVGELALDRVTLTGPVVVSDGTLAVKGATFRSNTVTVASGATLALQTEGTVEVPNADFETNTYDWKTGSLEGWTKTADTTSNDCFGSQKNKGTVSKSGPYTTESGPHTAIIRLKSGIQTTIRVAAAGEYDLSFDSAPRWSNSAAYYTIAVTALVDNVAVAYVPGRTADKGEFQTTRARLSLTAGEHVLTFHTDNSDGSAAITDGPMMFIDNISFTRIAKSTDFTDDGAIWSFAHGATLDIGTHDYALGNVLVDGVRVRGSKADLVAAGVTVTGSGRLRLGPKPGFVLIIR